MLDDKALFAMTLSGVVAADSGLNEIVRRAKSTEELRHTIKCAVDFLKNQYDYRSSVQAISKGNENLGLMKMRARNFIAKAMRDVGDEIAEKQRNVRLGGPDGRLGN